MTTILQLHHPNSDLELRANGTGQIVFRNNTNATGDLTVDGTTTFAV